MLPEPTRNALAKKEARFPISAAHINLIAFMNFLFMLTKEFICKVIGMELRIGWLFPELLSTYGDRGNIICLKKRAEWRAFAVCVEQITTESSASLISSLDLIVGGGSQNKDLKTALKMLKGKLGDAILENLESGMPALMICGAMQLLGKSIHLPSGEKKEGLGFFRCETYFYEHAPRISGDLIFKVSAAELGFLPPVIGFENHAGRTFLEGVDPLGKVILGQGNNGEDKGEGIYYKRALGSYAHGPLLPKNPFLADWLFQKALERKYRKIIELKPLEDLYVQKARAVFQNRSSCVRRVNARMQSLT